MKRTLIFLLTLFQACLICCTTGLLAMFLREAPFDHAIKIGWPFVFFTAFDVGNPILNHGVNILNFQLDLAIAFLISLPLVAAIRQLLK